MKLSDLSKSPVETEAVVASTADEKPADEPWGVAQVVTPSGIAIYYQAGPKRLYQIRAEALRPAEEGGYPTDWREVPSASSVLEVLEKGGLSWWGMKVGVEGVMELCRKGVIVGGDVDLWQEIARGESPIDVGSVWGVDDIVESLKSHKLTVNHVKGKAADRGTNVHTALELYADSGILPDPELYPENEKGYVAGLVAFLRDTKLEVEHSELMVASADFGYAGRFDVVGKLPAGKAVVKTYPKRADVVDVIDPDWRLLLDLKTSKDVYASYHLQLAGYEGAMEECGYGTVDRTAVVRVTNDGRYEVVIGRAAPEDFLAVLDVYRIVKRIEGKGKA